MLTKKENNLVFFQLHYFRCFASQELQDTAADVIGVDKYHQVRSDFIS